MLEDLETDGRCSGSHCRYQEDLNHLEGEVCILREEFDTRQGGLARELGAHCIKSVYHNNHRGTGKKNLHLMTTGTSDMRMERATDGNKPVTTPMMTCGMALSQVRKESVLR